MSAKKGPFLSPDHDHRGCVASALQAAEALCHEKGVRLTDLRRRVLEIVWESHRPVGAYAVLDVLRREQRAAPPTVYRALDFLQAHGLVHRIASLNAYVGCNSPERPHQGQFLICGSCKELAEVSDSRVQEVIRDAASSADFEVHRQTIEVMGTCTRCRGQASQGGKS
jgi:Fur family zinc uptake transcriptional regulator